jgi:hypothetical protein
MRFERFSVGVRIPSCLVSSGGLEMQSQTVSPSSSSSLQALEAICDVLDAVGVDQLPSPLQSTRCRLHRALERTDSVGFEQVCEDLADSLTDVTIETRLMTENLYSSECVYLWEQD